MLKTVCSLIALCSLIADTSVSHAATPSIGDVAPSWQLLPGTDGKLHSASEFDDAAATVVVFLCNKCPCARGYDARFAQLIEAYSDKGVRLVGINSNVGGIETMDGMQQRASKGKYQFPYLRDASQSLAKQFGATSTPHVFVLDGDRRIVYTGAYDDNRSEKRVKHHFVLDAVNAVLDNREVPVAVSKQFGCAINYQ